jgi:hypothetical protein
MTRQLPEAYQLKITLADSEPEVWRRLQVSSQIDLKELHDIVQRAMGWENQHSYAFRLRLGEAPCALQQSLADAVDAAEGKPIYYTYDFQSGWLHRIEIEEIAALGKTFAETPALLDELPHSLPYSALPYCIEGASACPPEGSGGVWGYEELMDRLEDTSAPDYIDLVDKYGNFDPYSFDVAAANSRLSECQ